MMNLNIFAKAHALPVLPTSASDFSKQIFKFLSVQLLTITVVISIYKWAGEHELRNLQYGLFFALLLVELFVFRIFKAEIDIRRRLLNLYPEAELPNQLHVGLLTWTPLFFIPVTAHLMLAHAKPQQSVPWIYRNNRFVVAFILLTQLFTVGFAALKSPQAGVLTSPSTAYIANISRTVEQSLKASQRMKKMATDGQKPAFDSYFMQGDLNSTKMILGMAAYFSAVEKYQSRIPATDNDDDKMEALKELIPYFAHWNPRRSALADISFISMLTPAALVEAALLALVDMTVADVSAAKVAAATEQYIKKQPNSAPLLAELYNTPLYKSAQASQQSRFLKYLEKLN